MRFEIKTGGAFLILAGLVGLSGAVFGLGLVAGYTMAKQNQPDLSQISTTYPLPSPASASESTTVPDGAVSPAEAASPAVASKPPKSGAASVAGIPSRHATSDVARAKPLEEPGASRSPAMEDSDDDTDTADSGAATAPAVAPPPAMPKVGKPYNIQIEAVMDKSGADEMVSRLKSLGYNAQEVKIALNGQVWYRVRVGPYASADDARLAQEKLREQYKQAYTTSH